LPRSVFHPGAAESMNFSFASFTRCQKSWRYSLTRVAGLGSRFLQKFSMNAARSRSSFRCLKSLISSGLAMYRTGPSSHFSTAAWLFAASERAIARHERRTSPRRRERIGGV
jgi:hypothetical protein